VGSAVSSSLWRRLALIGGLSAVAFVAPVLDLYGKNPEVFVANRSSAIEIVVFAVAATLVVPLAALGVMAIAGAIGRRAPEIVYRTIVGLLSVATGLVVSRQVLAEHTVGSILLAVGIGAALFLLAENLDTVFVLAAIALPVLMVMFLSTSATARLIWADPEVVEGAATVGSPANLVMIQLDEMPVATIMDTDGTINEALFPNFARLGEGGTWYRNALSDSIATTQSVPSILSGVRTEEGQSPSFVDHPNNLFTLVGPTFDMHVIEWVLEMCPEETCPDYAGRAPARFSNLLKDVVVVYGHLILPGTTREWLPSIDNSWKGFLGQAETPSGLGVEIADLPVPPDPQRQQWVNWVQRLINGIDADTNPTLSYAHLPSPHVPWVTNPSGTHYQRPEEYTEVEGVKGDGTWSLEPTPALVGFQRHLHQLGFLDTMLGRLFDHLDETETWDDTMIIVVADHGASFVPGEHRRWPYEDNREDLYRIPLFIKYPRQSDGGIVDLPVFGIDILPTIVDVMDIDTDWSFDGRSLLELDAERPHQPTRWCCNGDGIGTDLGSLFAQVERNHEWIPDQSSWLGVAGVGPNADLIGQPVTDLDVSETSRFRWSLDLGANLDSVDRSSGILQTLLTGRVELPEEYGTELLVVVNDIVAGVAHLSRDSASGGSFTGVITELLVNDGVNDVELLLAGPNGGWVAGLNEDLTLELVAEDGHVLDIVTEGGRRVQVDRVEVSADGWEMVGWAADINNKLTPDMIYVFAGSRLLSSGPPDVDNPNVVNWFKSEDLLTSGFKRMITRSQVPDGVDHVLVVAEFGAKAVADSVSLTG
jgi:hypothetical protein